MGLIVYRDQQLPEQYVGGMAGRLASPLVRRRAGRCPGAADLRKRIHGLACKAARHCGVDGGKCSSLNIKFVFWLMRSFQPSFSPFPSFSRVLPCVAAKAESGATTRRGYGGKVVGGS